MAAMRDSDAVIGAFMSAYIVMTREMKRRVATAEFADAAWVNRCAIAFANL